MKMSDATRAALLAARATSARTMSDWRQGAAYEATKRAFADCADSPERAADQAETLLADGRWAAALLAPLVDALASDPLFEPALPFQRDARRVGIVLFDCPAVSIAARVSSAAAMASSPPSKSIVFTGRTAVTRIVKGGGARLRGWTLGEVSPGTEACLARLVESRPLRDGLVYRSDGRTHAQLIDRASRDVVTLVATIRTGAASLLREVDIASGATMRIADADDRPSRTAMLLRFLRAAGRAEADGCFESASRAPEFHLRWAAMREWLALDAARAAPRLAEMARVDPSEQVRAAARRMLVVVEARLAEARCLA